MDPLAVLYTMIIAPQINRDRTTLRTGVIANPLRGSRPDNLHADPEFVSEERPGEWAPGFMR